jgi:6-pyruvoyltetrahydropterin/6-carboxytetrahydropterin synthase
MSYRICKRFEFSASHQLSSLPPQHPCSRLHGHNYAVEVVIEGMSLDEHGMLIDYRALDVFKAWLDQNVDHRHLNDVAPGGLTTAEALAEWFYGVLANDMLAKLLLKANALIRYVRVCETAKTYAQVSHYPRGAA